MTNSTDNGRTWTESSETKGNFSCLIITRKESACLDGKLI